MKRADFVADSLRICYAHAEFAALPSVRATDERSVRRSRSRLTVWPCGLAVCVDPRGRADRDTAWEAPSSAVPLYQAFVVTEPGLSAPRRGTTLSLAIVAPPAVARTLHAPDTPPVGRYRLPGWTTEMPAARTASASRSSYATNASSGPARIAVARCTASRLRRSGGSATPALPAIAFVTPVMATEATTLDARPITASSSVAAATRRAARRTSTLLRMLVIRTGRSRSQAVRALVSASSATSFTSAEASR